MSEPAAPTWIGARVRRREDDRLLRGRGRFAADVALPHSLHARVVRSSVAHGALAGVGTAEALALPGCVAVLAAADLAVDLGEVPRIPVRLPLGRDLGPWLQPVLAQGRVRYVGEPVAVVVATDPYVAEDAAELVEVMVTPQAGPLHAAGDTSAVVECGWGDVDGAFARAAHVVSARLRIGRHSGVPLEPRTLAVAVDPGRDRLEIWGATKVPTFNRRVLAGMLGTAESRIRMHAGDAGGGFGPRGEFYPEDFLVPYLARRLGRNLVWTEDRAENLVALNHSREQVHEIAVALDAEGRILALRDEVEHDNGAYIRTHGVIVADLTVSMLPGPYRMPAFAAAARVVHRAKTPAGTYRAPGRYEGTFVREHLLDLAAERVGLGPLELRRRNLLGPDELPHRRPITALGTDVVLDAGDYPALLATAQHHLAEHGWAAERDRLRADGVAAGIGTAFFVEKSGLGPSETAHVAVDPDGTVTLHTGATSLGQGVETVLAQVVADSLGVAPESVDVVGGDTDRSPDGTGSWASRSSVLAGGAAQAAADSVRAAALGAAARLLEADPADLCIVDGRVQVVGSPSAGVALGAVAATARLHADAVFEVEHMTYPYGVHAALVELDPGTGAVRVRRHLVAYEVGRALNPTLVEGQLVGGVAQGIGGALFEEFRYDADGQPLCTSFMDYLVPTAAEVPPVELVITENAPSHGNPLGVKGAGEGGVSGAGAAIANAVRDALGGGDLLGGLPIRPAAVLARLESA